MRDWLDSIEARTKTQAKYDKKNTVGFYMKLNEIINPPAMLGRIE